MSFTPPRRGLQDIRTLAGRPSGPNQNQRLFMRLCTLEMERERREQEYRVSSERARIAGERVSKLNTEINDILAKIGGDRSAGGVVEPKPDTGVSRHTYGPRRRAVRKDTT